MGDDVVSKAAPVLREAVEEISAALNRVGALADS